MKKAIALSCVLQSAFCFKRMPIDIRAADHRALLTTATGPAANEVQTNIYNEALTGVDAGWATMSGDDVVIKKPMAPEQPTQQADPASAQPNKQNECSKPTKKNTCTKRGITKGACCGMQPDCQWSQVGGLPFCYSISKDALNCADADMIKCQR